VKLPIVRVILYVKDVPRVAHFYRKHFGMKPLPSQDEGWLELESNSGGCNIALHRAASTQKSGAAIKVVFGVSDVRQFTKEREAEGLKFGPIHDTGTFEFANAKDPAGNSLQVSSRGLT
jgi:predicted enzyme related to lactoylglutathione lyase